MTNRTKRAFTLIELLVVIAIIAILAAILFPVLSQARESAKNAQLLAQMKQVGTSQAIYVTDNDDILPPASAVCVTVGGPCSVNGEELGWQDLCQPYMKNYDILVNNKRPPVTGPFPAGAAGEAARFRRLQHLGMPGRSAIRPTSPAFFTGTHLGQPVQFNGIAGFQILGPDTAVDPYASRVRTSSLSLGAIENPSKTCLISESGNWDMWFGLFGSSGTSSPLQVCGRWTPAAYNVHGSLLYSFGVTTATRPESGATNGYAQGATCFIPKGRSTYVATDSSARSVDFRRSMYGGVASNNSTAYKVIEAFNPEGL